MNLKPLYMTIKCTDSQHTRIFIYTNILVHIRIYLRHIAASKLSSQLHPENYEAAASGLANSDPLLPLGPILCNPSMLFLLGLVHTHKRHREKGWKAKVLRGSPIVSSLATINCQNVPHNSVRSLDRFARPPYIFKANALNWFLRGERRRGEGKRGPGGPGGALNPSVNHSRYLRAYTCARRGAERHRPTLVPRLVGRE